MSYLFEKIICYWRRYNKSVCMEIHQNYPENFPVTVYLHVNNRCIFVTSTEKTEEVGAEE